MRYVTGDSRYGSEPGPEEVALDAWLEDNGPYMSLREEGLEPQDSGLRAGAGLMPEPAES